MIIKKIIILFTIKRRVEIDIKNIKTFIIIIFKRGRSRKAL